MIHRRITNVNKNSLDLVQGCFLYLPTIIDSYSICLFSCKIGNEWRCFNGGGQRIPAWDRPCYDINTT